MAAAAGSFLLSRISSTSTSTAILDAARAAAGGGCIRGPSASRVSRGGLAWRVVAAGRLEVLRASLVKAVALRVVAAGACLLVVAGPSEPSR